MAIADGSQLSREHLFAPPLGRPRALQKVCSARRLKSPVIAWPIKDIADPRWSQGLP